MWGNAKGWVISGAILVLVVLLIYFAGQPPQITPPTNKFKQFRDSAALSVDPLSLGVKQGDKPCDAAELYRQVIDDFKENRFHYKAHYEEAKDALTQLQKNPPKSIAWVVEAADCSKCTLFIKKPQEVINYDNSEESIEALHSIGNYIGQIAALNIIQKKNDQAEPYLRGEFALGQHMYFERLRWQEFFVGTELMSGAANGMAKLARINHDDARADKLAAFTSAIDAYEKNVTPLWQAISTGGSGREGEMLPYPGDIFDFALNSQEPMWRTEAILKLGRIRYMDNVTVGDQRGAKRLVGQLAAPDKLDLPPGVKAAAIEARDLTREKFRMFGGAS